jgi:ABC-type multidrug transport system permease subunit
MQATSWVLVVYFLSGLSLDQGGWHFWVFYVIISLTVLNGAAMVRFLAAFAPDLVAANGMIGVLVAIFIVFAGFLVPRFEVKHYWVWAYYLDPLQWGITGLMANEFNSKRYDTLCGELSPAQIANNFAQCVNRPNQQIGHAYLAKGQFYTSIHWVGIAVTVLVGWFIVWTFLTLFSLSKIRHVSRIVITPTAEVNSLTNVLPILHSVSRYLT